MSGAEAQSKHSRRTCTVNEASTYSAAEKWPSSAEMGLERSLGPAGTDGGLEVSPTRFGSWMRTCPRIEGTSQAKDIAPQRHRVQRFCFSLKTSDVLRNGP